jgi:hypothetical protein
MAPPRRRRKLVDDQRNLYDKLIAQEAANTNANAATKDQASRSRSRSPPRPIDIVAHHARLEELDQATGIAAILEAREMRPKNTNNSYVPKQQEFIKWAKKQGYIDGVTVIEGKALSFLKEVAKRLPKRQSSKARASSDVPLEN